MGSLSRPMRESGICFAVAVCAGAMGIASVAVGQVPCGGYEISHIIKAPPCPFTGPPATIATGISPNGKLVCGTYAQCAGYTESFVYDTTTSEFFTLPRPKGIISSTAEDVSDDGLVVGQYEDTISSGYRGYIYDLKTSEYTIIEPLPGGTWSGVNAINSKGQCCGFRVTPVPGGETVAPWTAFIYDIATGSINDLGLINGESTYARCINDNGIAIGWMVVDNILHGYFWDGKRVTDLGTLAELTTYALAINNANDVVGASTLVDNPPDSISHAFLWQNGLMQDLGVLPGFARSTAGCINTNGTILGRCSQPGFNGAKATFILSDGVMQNLAPLLQPANALSGVIPHEITDLGVICGDAVDTVGDVVGFVLAPVSPIPGDANHNCVTDVDDMLIVINDWGKSKSSADLNSDAIVDIGDLIIVIENWTPK